MELMYRYVLYIGIIISILFVLFYFFKKAKEKKYNGGVKLANTFLIDDEAYYKRRKNIYKVLSYLSVFFLLCSIISSAYLCSRPYKREMHTEDKYCRDIILCLDVSTSVDEVNMKLVKQLVSTVEKLKGERFGIVIFNTSPVLLSPLTDDYEYIIECLENIRTALEMRIKMNNSLFYYPDDWYYWNAYISDGTLVGNEERGSSLIGDGLASTMNNFSKDDSNRTKIVIFATDNDPYGESLISLPDAAKMCRDRGITVYGIGTHDMSQINMQEMKSSVELTGGEFFIENKSNTFDDIVKRVESHSENLVPGQTYYTDVDYPEKPFYALVASVLLLFVVLRFMRK